MVREHDGRYECTLCGAVLDLAVGATTRVLIKAVSGAPNVRVIVHDGNEIHAAAARSRHP